MEKRKIILVDDHQVVREGLKLIFELTDNYEVVGEAGTGKEALELLSLITPDLILLDVNMPEMNGISVLHALKERKSTVPVVILTTFNEFQLIREGIQLGAKGYLLKDTDREGLFRTVDAALRGETLFQPEVTKMLFEGMQTETDVPDTESVMEHIGITERELMIIHAIAKGSASKEIAADMGISERTVKAHLTSIYQKLNVESRAEAVSTAMSMGLIRPEKR